MFSCFTPRHLAMAGILLAAAARAADAPPAASGSQPSASVTAENLTTSAITFLPQITDNYSRANWMAIEVDFDAKPANKVINDVAVTLMLAWDKPGATPPVDLVIASTVKLVGAIGGKRNVVFFFVPPETLARSSTGTPYDANHAPKYFAVQYKVGDAALPLGRSDYAPSFPKPEFASSFITMASGLATTRGLLFSETTVPSYILAAVLQRIGSNAFPTFFSPGG